MFKIAWKCFFLLTLLTGVIYPFLMTEMATLLMPYQAYGSLLFQNNQLRGSTLIGQLFTKEKYFWSRPSTNHYDPLKSTGSNLGPTSLLLKQEVEKRATMLTQFNPSSQKEIPTDLLYTSGSNIDPHISLEAAFFQLERVAKNRSLSPEILNQFILDHMEGNLVILGPRYVNVLKLNSDLDKQFPPSLKE